MNNTSNVSVQIECITPEVAIEYLKKNTANRTQVPTNIDYIEKCILQGDFFVTPNGIGFDEDGRLIDGQHRLEAIVRAGIPCQIAVFRGLSSNAYAHIDTGKKKTISDRLDVDNVTSAVIRFVYGLCTRKMRGQSIPTPAEIRHVYEKIDSILSMLKKRNSSLIYFSKAPVKAAAVTQIIANINNQGRVDNIIHSFDSLMSLDGANDITRTWIKLLHTEEKALKGESPERLFARALFAFDPENADKKIMSQKKMDDATPKYLEDARRVMRDYLMI